MDNIFDNGNRYARNIKLTESTLLNHRHIIYRIGKIYTKYVSEASIRKLNPW